LTNLTHVIQLPSAQVQLAHLVSRSNAHLRLERLGAFAHALYDLGRVLGRLVCAQLDANLLDDVVLKSQLVSPMSLQFALNLRP